MRLWTLAWAILVCVEFLPSPAEAFVRVYLVGDLTLSTPKIISAALPTVKAKPGFGFGGLLEIPLGGSLGIEFGGLYLARKSEISSSVTESIAVSTVMIPATFRIWIARYVTLVGGVYYAMDQGDLSVTDSGGTVTKLSHDAYGIGSADLGMLGGGGINIPIKPWINVLAEFRYIFGVFYVSQAPGATWSYRDLQFLAGIRLGKAVGSGGGAGGGAAPGPR